MREFQTSPTIIFLRDFNLRFICSSVSFKDFICIPFSKKGNTVNDRTMVNKSIALIFFILPFLTSLLICLSNALRASEERSLIREKTIEGLRLISFKIKIGSKGNFRIFSISSSTRFTILSYNGKSDFTSLIVPS